MAHFFVILVSMIIGAMFGIAGLSCLSINRDNKMRRRIRELENGLTVERVLAAVVKNTGLTLTSYLRLYPDFDWCVGVSDKDKCIAYGKSMKTLLEWVEQVESEN